MSAMPRRLGAALGATAALGALAIGTGLLVGESSADLENPGRDGEPRVFASAAHGIRMVVPRAWRATDQPSYPGLILWIMRSQPPAQIVLTSEAFTREQYCSWPPACRAAQDSLTGKLACAIRTRLGAQRLRVGPPQPGPKENAAAGLPSAWFEYDDGKRFLRHAVALTEERVYSLVLASPTDAARAAHARSFEQMLRTLRPLTPEEAADAEAAPAGAGGAAPAPGSAAPGSAAPGSAAPAGVTDAGVTDAGVTDAGVTDAGAPPPPPGDAAIDGGLPFESAPAPRVAPVGPCPPR